MEHRYHPRVAIDLKTMIYRRGLPVATGKIRDAGRGGVFLQTEYPEVHRHQHLELEFRLNGEQCGALCRIEALVLRCARDGVALAIDEADYAAFNSMESLLVVNGARPADRQFQPSASAA